VPQIEIEIQDEDGNQLVMVGGEVEVGGPPGIPPGQDQRVQLAADMTLTIERPRTYCILAKVAGEVLRRTTFRIAPGPLLATQQGRRGDAA
jgi:hypothetical protein